MVAFELVEIFVASLAMATMLVVTRRLHGRWTGDFEDSGLQKHHKGAPPRIGLLAPLTGLLIALCLLSTNGGAERSELSRMLGLIVLCGLPAALIGLVEDITKKVRARWRLLFPVLGAGLAIVLMGTAIPRVGLPLLDTVVAWAPLSIGLTLLLVCGFTNAMNIVDGLNGLASGLTLLMLAATAIAAHQAHDALIVQLCAMTAMAVLGFVVVNFPRGLIFLGDGGAYFLGFVMVQIWILLVIRNPGQISPWFIMAVAFHPTMETIFSIVRRKLRVRRNSATAPDRLHLHTLVYRRRTRPLLAHYQWAKPWMGNSLASLAVLAMAALPMFGALINPANTSSNIAVIATATLVFLGAFRHMVLFRSRTATSAPSDDEASVQTTATSVDTSRVY